MRNFLYRCRLTLPEIEIMGADLPHTLLNYSSGKPRGRRATQEDVDDATEKMREAYERKMREREKRKAETGPTVDEIFGGALED